MKRSLPKRHYASAQLVQIAIIVFIFVGSIGIVGVGFVFRQAFNSNNQVKTIQDASRYPEIRHKLWLNQNQVRHFPYKIPTNASNVRLGYSRGILQGNNNNFFQLRLKLPQEQINNLHNQYEAIAKHKYIGGNTNIHANLANGVPTTFFYTSNSQQDSFPNSYEILVLGANDRSSSDFKWNHGDSYGVAIDVSASEIIYWAEEW
ncbi:hypothetical protein B4U84_02910 [Westiellopsis prolifica IICB1]|nr:hypothetical protein B4U84_02910 [Westiellopsis prolifica IICB1]